jgi:hypothetical protein
VYLGALTAECARVIPRISTGITIWSKFKLSVEMRIGRAVASQPGKSSFACRSALSAAVGAVTGGACCSSGVAAVAVDSMDPLMGVVWSPGDALIARRASWQIRTVVNSIASASVTS